jgi:hypothetical protein
MAKRAIRVTKHIHRTPVVAICTACHQEFKAPMTTFSSAKNAEANLQLQFNRHKCKAAEPSPKKESPQTDLPEDLTKDEID